MKHFLRFLALCLPVSGAAANGVQTSVDPAVIPVMKQTQNGQYLSSIDAMRLLAARPDALFVDVRDPVEIALDGHPTPIKAIAPVMVRSEVYDPELREHRLVRNDAFMKQMDAILLAYDGSRDDTIIVTCGSGRRSAMAANILIRAGFSDVWHITDGYPGDEKEGLNTHNAWHLADLPWSDTTADATVFGSEWVLRIE
jgi:rhodanese-related sulfurtransferase